MSLRVTKALLAKTSAIRTAQELFDDLKSFGIDLNMITADDDTISYECMFLDRRTREMVRDMISLGLMPFAVPPSPPPEAELELALPEILTEAGEEEFSYAVPRSMPPSVQVSPRCGSDLTGGFDGPISSSADHPAPNSPLSHLQAVAEGPLSEVTSSQTSESDSEVGDADYFSSLRYASISAPVRPIPWKLVHQVKEYVPPSNLRPEDLTAIQYSEPVIVHHRQSQLDNFQDKMPIEMQDGTDFFMRIKDGGRRTSELLADIKAKANAKIKLPAI